MLYFVFQVITQGIKVKRNKKGLKRAEMENRAVHAAAWPFDAAAW